MSNARYNPDWYEEFPSNTLLQEQIITRQLLHAFGEITGSTHMACRVESYILGDRRPVPQTFRPYLFFDHDDAAWARGIRCDGLGAMATFIETSGPQPYQVGQKMGRFLHNYLGVLLSPQTSSA